MAETRGGTWRSHRRGEDVRVRAPNRSKTYFCHRIPPLRFEKFRRTPAAPAAGLNGLQQPTTRLARSETRGAFHRCAKSRRAVRSHGELLLAIRFESSPCCQTSRDPCGTRTNQRNPDGAHSSLSGVCLENVGKGKGSFKAVGTNRTTSCSRRTGAKKGSEAPCPRPFSRIRPKP